MDSQRGRRWDNYCGCINNIKDRGEDLRIKEGIELVCDWKGGGGCKKSADGKICKQIQQKMIVHVVVKAMKGEIFKNWFCIN